MRAVIAVGILSCLVLCGRPAVADPAGDEAAARALFEQNLQAIADRDTESYLACYWQSDGLVRNGFEGISRGYAGLAASVDEDTWPDQFEATDLQVFWLRPGVVYGQYRYRVRYGDDEQEGISERILLETEAGWRIAVTTAFGAPEGALPPEGSEP